jgi:hypothetical protein
MDGGKFNFNGYYQRRLFVSPADSNQAATGSQAGPIALQNLQISLPKAGISFVC